jgi:tetratricopeptide (TPR) repeat protein
MNGISRKADASLGRNDPCPCGSGKKHKKCCGSAGAQSSVTAPPAPAAADMNRLAQLANAGRYPELEMDTRELLLRYPGSGLLWKILGVALWSTGKDPLPSMERAAELLPDDAESHGNLGNVYRARGQFERALQSHRRALALNPDYAEAHNNLGSVLQDLGNLEEAAASFRRAATLKPDFALAHSNLGNVLSLLNRAEECQASCRRALAIDPHLTAAMVQLAEGLADRGQFTDAEDLLKRAIAVEPDMPEAWAGLARWRRMNSADSEWLAAALRIVGQPLVPRREIHLRYALGKYFDDVADYDAAFSNYQRANELAKTGRPAHDQRQFSRGIDRIIQTFDRQWIERARAAADPSPRPVFVIGMPRSGTTLTEQILDSHAAVLGAGELPFWNTAATRYAKAGSGEAALDALRELANEYVTLLDRLAPSVLRIVDKMPANFLYLGLIHAVLPNAKIMHMQRHPIDTCLSIYFQNFDAKHSYANDLGDLAHYYGEYLRLMDHWRRTLPGASLLEVPYEALVQDTEGWTRKMLGFIDLPWDSNCLEFHRNDRVVDTASKWQARQKISRSSVERWRHYEKFIGPLGTLIHDREPA